jgi:DNA topoisomerase-2
LSVWYRGFTGDIESFGNSGFLTRGKFHIENDNTVIIKELPIGKWTEDYIEFLDKVSVERGKEDSKNFVKYFKDDSSENNINILIKLEDGLVHKWNNKLGKDGINELENKLKLNTTVSLNNMHVFDEFGIIKKFTNIDDLISYWFNFRIKIYEKRRDYLLKNLKVVLDIIRFKVKFILEIIEGTLEIRNVKKALVIQGLENKEYPKIAGTDDTPPSYDYLLKMDLYKLTEEEVIDLKKKKDLKELEYNTLLSKSADTLWKEDLLEFKTAYTKFLDSYIKANNPTASKKKVVIKKK